MSVASAIALSSAAHPSIRERIEGQHIPALDAIRGIAALMVVVAHMGLLPEEFGALGVAISSF